MTAGDRGFPRSPSALLPPLGLWPEDSDALEAHLFVQRRALNPDVVMGRSRGSMGTLQRVGVVERRRGRGRDLECLDRADHLGLGPVDGIFDRDAVC